MSEALDAAWEQLHDHAAGRGSESLARAAEAVQGAIEALAFLQRRLSRLDGEQVTALTGERA